MISFVYDSPIGPLTLASNGEAITQLEFENPKHPLPPLPRGRDKIIDKACKELDAYFAGKLKQFTVPVAPQGTAFQRKAWAALQKIPYGDTRSYGQQAKVIGSPAASRAVGSVCSCARILPSVHGSSRTAHTSVCRVTARSPCVNVW